MITYSAAISACEKAMQSEWALEQKRTGPYVITYSASITFSAAFSACGKAKQSVKALELLEVMRHKGLAPSLILYDAVVSAVRMPSSQWYPTLAAALPWARRGSDCLA